jgi:uncharacterized protein (TIGR00255 family)
MPVYSMTGYASAVGGAAKSPVETPSKPDDEAVSGRRGAGAQVGVELRSVNSRFLDLAFRLPDELRGLEPALRELIAAQFRRGKIELRLSTQRSEDSAWPQPQTDQLHQLSRIEGTIQGWLPKAAPLSVNEVLHWCRGASTTERLDEAAMDVARKAIAALREAREREGERLVGVLLARIASLRELAAQAAPLVPQVVARQQERFLLRWNEALRTAGADAAVPAQALQERALNEAAAFAIRVDVDEELSRLGAHLDELTRLLQGGGELGKRLDFLIQELHREANTLGSKSPALELTQISVEMKVLIEQMREQVQNIE